MTTRTVTIALILVTVACWLAWDVFAAIGAQQGATISEVVYGAARGHPAIPFGVGFICGHLFWPQKMRTLYDGA